MINEGLGQGEAAASKSPTFSVSTNRLSANIADEFGVMCHRGSHRGSCGVRVRVRVRGASGSRRRRASCRDRRPRPVIPGLSLGDVQPPRIESPDSGVQDECDGYGVRTGHAHELIRGRGVAADVGRADQVAPGRQRHAESAVGAGRARRDLPPAGQRGHDCPVDGARWAGLFGPRRPRATRAG